MNPKNKKATASGHKGEVNLPFDRQKKVIKLTGQNDEMIINAGINKTTNNFD